MVTQNYIISQNFQLSNQAQLSVEDPGWGWSHRTLSGLMTPDLHLIQPGSITSFSAQETEVSGVWSLDKDVTIALCCFPAENSSGRISASFHESCKEAPDFDEDHPYSNVTTLIETSSYSIYYGTSAIFEVNAAPGTTITDIKFNARGSYYVNNQWIRYENVIENDNDEPVQYTQSLNKDVQYRYIGRDQLNYITLSVWYTNQGVLKYNPNQIYVDWSNILNSD